LFSNVVCEKTSGLTPRGKSQEKGKGKQKFGNDARGGRTKGESGNAQKPQNRKNTGSGNVTTELKGKKKG